MKIKPVINKGKVVDVIPEELTDSEKICLAIKKILNENKQEQIGKEHLSLIDSSLKIKKHDKNSLGQGKRNVYGYAMYSHNTEVEFKMHKDYNAQKNGDWGSHKIIPCQANIAFHDIEDKQVGNFQDVKIILKTLTRSDK